ncbi:MAG: diguanylate cyclase [Synergistaceae bacterium]|jgi:diguanylate cyclase (GGDEF)-like protein|nr:diguanylate cyclase [Synergistaceae bacterium]
MIVKNNDGKESINNANSPEDAVKQAQEALLKFVYALLTEAKLPESPESFVNLEKFPEVLNYMVMLRSVIYGFSHGNIDAEVSQKGFLAGCLKELQAHLRHLAWYADRLASGDFEQRIDFMGDFSEYFNRMSQELCDTLKTLKDNESNLLKLTKDLHLSEERWKLAVTCTQDGVWDIDLTERRAFFSPRLWEILRRPVIADDIDFDPVLWGSFIHPDDLSKWSDIMNSLNSKIITDPGRRYTELRVMDGDGKYRWIGVHHMIISNSEKMPVRFVGTCEDIQERREREDEIRTQATHDQLTRLPNRYLYNDRFLQKMVIAKRNESSIVLLLWDLDGFKWVNDTYGHLAGDKLLVMIAELMRISLRETDTLARFGGDEFVMLLSCPRGHEDEVAACTTDRIYEMLEEPIDIGVGKVFVGASCGISFFPKHAADGESLFSLADRALYTAKSSGKNCAVIWTPDRFKSEKALV